MLEALGDPYTTYFSPEEYGAFTGSMSDTDTVGVGIYSLVTADGPLIQRVYENTPAADAGLQPGDLVTAVDGRKLTFAVTAYDETGPIGKGTHERFIIQNDKFLAKAQGKKKGN